MGKKKERHKSKVSIYITKIRRDLYDAPYDYIVPWLATNLTRTKNPHLAWGNAGYSHDQLFFVKSNDLLRSIKNSLT